MADAEKPSLNQQTPPGKTSTGIHDEPSPPTPKPLPWNARAWTKLKAEKGTFILMFKGAIPPTVSLAIYQSTSVATHYSTLGYLVAIMSILSFAIMPRAKFIQTMFLNVLGICIGACIGLLTIYSSTQARKHTTPPQPTSNGPSPGTKVTAYNSSASAVSAIWLFFNIWLSNTLRASRPQLQFPVICYSIYANIASIYAPTFPTMTFGIAFTKRLIETFLTGFAIATGVSLFIFPMSCRAVFFKQSVGFIALVKAAFAAQSLYLKSLENEDMFSAPKEDQNGTKHEEKDHFNIHHHQPKKSKPAVSSETENLKKAINSIGELHGKMNADITFAKREIAYGKLNASDIDEFFMLLREILLPLMGMSSAADLLHRVVEIKGWTKPRDDSGKDNSSTESDVDGRVLAEKRQWNRIMKTLQEPFEVMSAAMNEGLNHATDRLELVKRPKESEPGAFTNNGMTDIEAEAGKVKPGDDEFAQYLKEKIQRFYDSRKATLEEFCKVRGIRLDRADDVPTGDKTNTRMYEDSEEHRHNQRQLFLLLEIEYLLWSTGQAVLNLVIFSDRKVSEGGMKRKRIILPGLKRLKKWFLGLFKVEDTGTEHSPDSTESGGANIYAGTSYEVAKDPEHLPPTNAWQRFSGGLRSIGGFLSSPASGFGLRAACATMSVGIVVYLADTQAFFLDQRLVWAMIMISIGMTTTAGSGIFGFLGRIAGTTIAMCMSFAIWYIVDGHIAGVLVFVFVFSFFEFYILLKYPRLIIIALISMVTQVLIIGYELQIRKVGLKVGTANGQPFYAIYLLAPYRLACVTGGMAVAFIWTIFPYPITARSQLRQDLGLALYLLANFYSIVHTTVTVRVNGLEPPGPHPKSSPSHKLSKARTQVFAKEIALLAGLRQHSAFTAWEPTFGGKFPRGTYDAIILSCTHILQYLALISYASSTFTQHNDDPSSSNEAAATEWQTDFSHLVCKISTTSQEITSILALLSASVAGARALPPYLKPPEAYMLAARLEELDREILGKEHVLERGYSAFAVMQIASRLVGEEVGGLIENVKILVGEVDFTFHIHSTADSSTEALFDKDVEKGKKD